MTETIQAIPDLTLDEISRVQATIDAGTVWATVEGGRFAMKLIDAGRCKLAPGVVFMWLTDDDHYEPIYSKDELSRRTTALLNALPGIIERGERADAELRFYEKHRDQLVKIETERLLDARGIDPAIPALLVWFPVALVLYLIHIPWWLAMVPAGIAYWIQRRRNLALQRDSKARVSALRVAAGLPPNE